MSHLVTVFNDDETTSYFQAHLIQICLMLCSSSILVKSLGIRPTGGRWFTAQMSRRRKIKVGPRDLGL